MIRGAPCWNTGKLYFQTDDSFETLRPLEYCGPTAIANAWAALGGRPGANNFGGTWPLRPPDAVIAYFLTKSNWPMFQVIRPLDLVQYPPNRVPQYHPRAALDVLGMAGDYHTGLTWASLIGSLEAQHAVVICLKKPGHYVACVAYDDDSKRVAFKDSWGADYWLPNSPPDANGNRWFSETDFNSNVEAFYLDYRGLL